ncbi:MAG: 16S rRNA (cytosine(1402)-N(4))-methyltransferase RsmH [Candidatus Beckwithbacteria bacterium]|nr:16S rRNA (cytosine(1402)-N(4))-methyltransferase RsmH [Candidatus Beckwithbacteria bacterium]
MTDNYLHQPVLLHEVIDSLQVKPGEAYLDATIGSAGHAVEIVKRGGRVFGLDVDPAALERARNRLHSCPGADFKLTKRNFGQLEAAAKDWQISAFSGILFDLGLSSDQLADDQRGFSFLQDSPLDMRADPDLAVTAADLVNGLNKGELNELFQKLGEEPRALAISDEIVHSRARQPITTTAQLVKIVKEAVGGRYQRINPATKVFQALRIAVNDELNNLKAALPQAVALLKPGGRLAVISFHSLEDRIVKNFMKDNQNLKILYKHPVKPGREEILANPRSRSAKLRVAIKL